MSNPGTSEAELQVRIDGAAHGFKALGEPVFERDASERELDEVGIGLDAEGSSISLLKIPGVSYIRRKGTAPAELRWIGQVAARLSKGEPLPVGDNTGGGIRYE